MEYNKKLTSKVTLAAFAWSGDSQSHSHSHSQSHVSHSHGHTSESNATARRLAHTAMTEAAAKAAEGVAQLLDRVGSEGACALTGPERVALAPLCAGLGKKVGHHLAELFSAEEAEEQATESREEGHQTSQRSVTGQSKRCSHSLQAGGDVLAHYQAWQRRVSLTYSHQMASSQRKLSITIDLDIPIVDFVPTGFSPGKDYGTLPKAPETGCYSKSAVDTISAIIEGSCA